jgi:hypothetical protein
MYLHVPQNYLEFIVIETDPVEIVVRKTELVPIIIFYALCLFLLDNINPVFHCFPPSFPWL